MKKVLTILLAALAVMIIAVSCDDHVHTYSDGWTWDDTYHWHPATCEHTDAVKDKAEHTLVEHKAKAPTCTEKGWDAYVTCSVCGYSTYKEKPATGHTLVKHDGQSATCTEKGWKEYESCSVCGYTTYEEIAPLGHEMSLWEDDEVTDDTKIPQKTRKCTREGCTYSETENVITGKGTAEDPLEIATPNGLVALAEACNDTGTEENESESVYGFKDAVIKLVQDIDLSGVENWTPIGNGTRSGNGAADGSTPFKGTFDGNNHTISNLKIADSDTSDATKAKCMGLFGILDGGTVKNLKLAEVSISAPGCENVGALAGMALNNSTIDNVTVESGSVTAINAVGGIVGRMFIEGTINKCTNKAAVTSDGGVGGIIGKGYYSEKDKEINITDCHNEGNITATGSGYVGGIAGLLAGNVSGCSNSGTISGTVNGIGGIVGELAMYGSVKESTNTGAVGRTQTAATDKPENGGAIGGIVGWARYSATNTAEQYKKIAILEVSGNTNSGSITNGYSSGGIVGLLYNVGVVDGNNNTAATITGGNFASGIVGAYQHGDGFGEFMKDDSGIKATVISNNTSTTLSTAINASCHTDIVWDNTSSAGGANIVKNTPSTNDNRECYIAGSDGSKTYYKTFEDGVHAAAKDGATVEVTAAEVKLDNAHCPEVNGSVTINANGCDFGGGDISIYTYNSHTAEADNKSGDVKIVINKARNLGIWGDGSKAAEGTTISIEVNDCTFDKTGACWIVLRGNANSSSGANYFKGTLNIKVNNCKAENLNDTTTLASDGYQANQNNAVLTNLANIVKVTNSTFKNVFMPISVTKDSAGKGEVIVDNCTFEDCGRSPATETASGDDKSKMINPSNVKLAAPIRVRHSADSVDGSSMKVTIKNSSITGTKCIEDLGDVLLVEARDGKKWKSLTAVFENNTTDLKVKVAVATEGESGFKTVSKGTTETIEVAANTTT